MVKKGLLFKGQDAALSNESYQLDTGSLPGIEDDSWGDTRQNFRSALGLDTSDDELLLPHRLTGFIAVRGAHLCTCGVAAICRKKNIGSGHVAAERSVANKHPKLKQRWAQALSEVLDWRPARKDDPITITSAEDGSGIGAAVICAMTLRKGNEGHKAGIQQQ